MEDEARAKDAARDCLHASERRANSMQNALEEARTLLEQADRSRRITEQDLSDTNEQLSDLTCTNQSIAGAKRKLESEMQTLNVSGKINVVKLVHQYHIHINRVSWTRWHLRLRCLTRRPRRLWLMLPGWLTN